jgi:Ca2+-transporting ATPase
VDGWSRKSAADVIQDLSTDAARGLSSDEAARRLKEHGPNELIERGVKSPWRIFAEQFTEVLVIVLIVAALVSVFLGDLEDAVVIMAIVVLNAAIGFRQEYRAERAMAALKKLSTPVVKVHRDGGTKKIPATELVVGDIVLLEAGDAIPADGRLLEAANLRIQEAALTGESEPVEKDPRFLAAEDTPLGDRRNMAYMGTVATYGRGMMAVVETGMATELGHIAEMLQTVQAEPTPLQKRLDRLGKSLALAVLVIVAIIFVIGMLRRPEDREFSEYMKELFLTAVAMAVAAVPEGLPAVVTIALSLGAQRMLKRNALIRKLPAVETLGSVTVICSDKTGTLTRNEMTVTVLDVAGRRVDVAERFEGGEEIGAAISPADARELMEHSSLSLLLLGSALCNDASIEPEPKDRRRKYKIVGDPTEAALVVAAAELGLDKNRLERAMPRDSEVPFDSDRKLMTTVHHLELTDGLPEGVRRLAERGADLADSRLRVAFTKGAVDRLLEVSNRYWTDDETKPLDDETRRRITQSHDHLASEGVRVLGLAFEFPDPARSPEEYAKQEAEQHLVFVGLVGMIDPPRPEVRDAVQTCREAGIRPVMITGDHPLTARNIAGQLAFDEDSKVVTGQELNNLMGEAFDTAARETPVFARVSPEHKLRLVQSLQMQGEVVAMTGDGVNDAPALKQADIGVAMGITGTDVAKEAAAMVLRDDNFATIVSAVREGRIVYDNIRKFIKYAMTGNSGEIWAMFLAPFLGMPLPLLPLQILWINLVTDGLPGLAFSAEPGERDTMRRPPHAPGESIFARGMGWHVLWIGLVLGVVSLTGGWLYWRPEVKDHTYMRTIVFTVLTLAQMGHALAIRSERDSLFRQGLFSNKYMLGSVALTFVLQLGVIYLPWLQGIFGTTSLTLRDLAICLALSTVVFWSVEAEKLVRRMTSPA